MTDKAKKTTPKKKNTRGVLLVALGHPYYGRFAANLAMSIRHTSPNVNICLVHDSSSISHMSAQELAFFTKKVNCKNEWNMINGVDQHIMSKLYINKMSPYDETLYLDVDMIWHPKRSVDSLFDDLSSLDFTMQNRGFTSLKGELSDRESHWCNLNELKHEYGIKDGTFWHLSSEFIYFKKTKDVNSMFSDAQKHYKTIKVSHTQFGEGIPDELCFALSMLRHTSVVPHRVSYTPIFWSQAETNERNIDPTTMYSNWYGYSMGGATNSAYTNRCYDNLVQYYANKSGIANPFRAKDKRSFLKGRTHI